MFYSIRHILVILSCISLLSAFCTNTRNMPKKKQKDEVLLPDSNGSQGPTDQQSPTNLPVESTESESTGVQQISIGVPMSEEELQKLKRDSLKQDKKKKKPKAPDKHE